MVFRIQNNKEFRTASLNSVGIGGSSGTCSNIRTNAANYGNSHSHGANHDDSQYQCEYFFHCDFLLLLQCFSSIFLREIA